MTRTREAVVSKAPGSESAHIGRAMIAAFVGIVLAFTLGLFVTGGYVARILAAADDITRNASPSIDEISTMRTTLRQLEVAIDMHVFDCAERGCGEPPGEIAELRDSLRTTWSKYVQLPPFPGETQLWPPVASGLDELAGEITLVLRDASRPGGTDPRRVRAQLTPAVDRVDAALARIIDKDHVEGLAAAERIDRTARTALRAAVALALAVIGFSVLIATLALRLGRRYERALRDRSDDLEHFAGRVAHDLKSPLTAVSTALHVVARRAPEGAQAVRTAQRAVGRVHALVDDLLEFARSAAMDPGGASADVRDVVDEVVTELSDVARERAIVLKVEEVGHERVACSPGVLGSIVGNIVRNAVTHMGSSEHREVLVRSARAADRRMLRIEVGDTGPGIPDSLGAQVFEPFVRGEGAGAGGAGLGLATVRRFVQAHRGNVGFRSAVGSGTTFWIELPRSAAAGPRAVVARDGDAVGR
jgi:signal transduction histidine kinase